MTDDSAPVRGYITDLLKEVLFHSPFSLIFICHNYGLENRQNLSLLSWVRAESVMTEPIINKFIRLGEFHEGTGRN
jgi:hypothetical protein